MPARYPFGDDEEEPISGLFDPPEEPVDPNNLDFANLPDGNESNAYGDGGQVPSSAFAGAPPSRGSDQSLPSSAFAGAKMPQVDSQGAAEKRYQDVLARAPEVMQREKPSIWRKLAAAGTGFAEGYHNASPGTRHPVDTSHAVQEILYPGQARKEAAYGMEKDAAAEAAKAEQTAKRNAAQEKYEGQRGQYYEGLNQSRKDAKETAAKIQAETAFRKADGQVISPEDRGGAMSADTALPKMPQVAPAVRPEGWQGPELPAPDTLNAAPQLPENAGVAHIEASGTVPATIPKGYNRAPSQPSDAAGTIRALPQPGEVARLREAAKQENWDTLPPEVAAHFQYPPDKKIPKEQWGVLVKAWADTQKPDKLVEVDPKVGAQMGVMPDADGKYRVPPSAVGAHIRGTTSIAVHAGGGGGMLSAGGLDAAAQALHEGGSIPAGFSRNPQVVARIVNRYAELFPGESMVGNKALFDAAKGSMVAMQKQRDAVVAFERTAGKNLDLFLTQAKKVIDSGSPLINQPLRAVNSKLLGDQDLAAYNTARQVALTEIAKVTNNPSLAGQLSDSARHEVTSLIPAEATLGQIYSVANILKQDMANRRESYDQSLGEMKSHFGGSAKTNPAQQPTQQGASPSSQQANPNPTGYIKNHVYGGLTYLGGDPNNPASWKK